MSIAGCIMAVVVSGTVMNVEFVERCPVERPVICQVYQSMATQPIGECMNRDYQIVYKGRLNIVRTI